MRQGCVNLVAERLTTCVDTLVIDSGLLVPKLKLVMKDEDCKRDLNAVSCRLSELCKSFIFASFAYSCQPQVFPRLSVNI